ncbi:MAG: bifunctional phosphoribosylaminoimidazolecarboxamide formyltransferase/IMP cyclohydrolase PurH [Cytophagales bacterium]|nr:MAG: bifunctional phosphoribosylaminoimidazolecarboxamide formyltransferase/IMP cyclohydrolase PurH [Cytophagales bacterium]TAF59702.1 MAG: bifunctional phosphoribosylaminoimidazolecarboxamide formyltransferase/IMP cyclohydrolase PurH [Cytophagales bacterium]
MQKTIHSALVSVYYKDGLEPIIHELNRLGIVIYSTGGTQKFIENLGVPVTSVEEITQYPAIFGGRVKTLHPKIFGGILYRRNILQDEKEALEFRIPNIDLVIVDLYPFSETVAQTHNEEEIIEKIDIGGVSLIRAAAKNFRDTLIVCSKNQYADLEALLKEKNGKSELHERKHLAIQAFLHTASYDSAIFNHFLETNTSEYTAPSHFLVGNTQAQHLRYGENPHQKATFFGNLNAHFTQLNGKELSYNNLVDVEAALSLLDEFEAEAQPAFVIVKHTNACGVALGQDLLTAYQKALSADPLSAFGGVLVCNKRLDMRTAEALNTLFFEILVAPDFEPEALALLKTKKNRIILARHASRMPKTQFKSVLGGVLVQDKDLKSETADDLKVVTTQQPTDEEVRAMLFAAKIAKHTKSNTIVLASESQLLASGTGQTSRIDALKQAIQKAHAFGFSLQHAAMASDAFFPFSDCVETAHQAGIKAVIQPGGSVRDQDSVDFCNQNGMTMVITGTRHFKH